MGKKESKKRRKSSDASAGPSARPTEPAPVPGRATKAKRSKDTCTSNPLLSKQTKFLSSIPSKARRHFFSEKHVDGEARADIWTRQADLGEQLVDRYAWATPDGRALGILRHFSPIVEIGCGANAYWAQKMHSASIDVVAYDLAVEDGGHIQKKEKKGKKRKSGSCAGEGDGNGKHFAVRKGGPDILASGAVRNRALFLCYPDEDDKYAGAPRSQEDDGGDEQSPLSMGAQCLEHYQGDIVIHVGELHGDTLSLDQAPWGRSSAPEFQQRLAAEYHCLLKAALPNWLHVRDTISVWKRSQTCTMVFEGDEEDDDSDEEIEYKYIPPSEQMPQDLAAPCLSHLLGEKKIARRRTESNSN
mmetsp:Transcript_10068/g.28228  ORF Transcript_10068/g.28228 Transcript_10068/m.28228 type:complete len:358 (-) Transcript_10068:166-1239(-)